MNNPLRPVFVKGQALSYVPASHEDRQNPGVLKKVLLDSGLGISGKLQMVNWARMEPGKGFCRHYHQDMCEVFVLVSGSSEMKVNDSMFKMDSGDAVIVPANCEHEMSNSGSEAVEYLVFGISEGRGGKTITVG